MAPSGLICNFFLYCIESRARVFILTSDYLMKFVLYAE